MNEYTDVSRRDFLKASAAATAVAGAGLGGFWYGYDKTIANPVRLGVIGTGDEGGVLIGALNPDFVEVKAIADIRPYNQYRAFHGDYGVPPRKGMMNVFGWKTEDEAHRHVKVYGKYQELLANAKNDGIEAIIIALPLHLHAPVAIAAMQQGLHVLTEKLMGQTVHECKEMARIAELQNRYLAVGHQRHYNVKYEQAKDWILRGRLGDVHSIRAQWHRNNLPPPSNDSWKQPLPPEIKGDDDPTKKLIKEIDKCRRDLMAASGREADGLRDHLKQFEAQLLDAALNKKGPNGKTTIAEDLGYTSKEILDADGKVAYTCPAIEELIRWRLWDRTGAGMMAELGSHQMDAASIFVSATHGGVKQHPLRVVAAANRPLFGHDRDIEDHVYCVLEFPAPGYDPKDEKTHRKKIVVQYASINGNGYLGYGELVYGTKGTLALEKEQDMKIMTGPADDDASETTVKVSGGSGGPTLNTQASGPARKAAGAEGGPPVSKGYAEEIEHWAWCIRHPDPENQPRCRPKVAMADAVIALTANMSAAQGQPMKFNEDWFEIQKDDTPEGIAPDIKRYKV